MTEWNIEEIASEVIREMKKDSAGIEDVDGYIHHIAYLTVFEKVPEDAETVATKVKNMVIEKYR